MSRKPRYEAELKALIAELLAQASSDNLNAGEAEVRREYWFNRKCSADADNAAHAASLFYVERNVRREVAAKLNEILAGREGVASAPVEPAKETR